MNSRVERRGPQVRVEVRQAMDEDSAFVFSVTEEAMRAYVEATWSTWDRRAQQRAHAQSFSTSTHWIVFADGAPAGLVAAEIEACDVQLIKLYLRTGSRGNGVGARILSALLRSAASRSQPLRLRVLAVNTRAQAFYARNGFRETFRTAERVFMEARPHPFIERTSETPLRALYAPLTSNTRSRD